MWGETASGANIYDTGKKAGAGAPEMLRLGYAIMGKRAHVILTR